MECLECGEKIVGRADKKFCNDACRNAYNNKKNRQVSDLVAATNRRLRKNYKILENQTFTDGKLKIPHAALSSQGFDFELMTRRRVYKNGSEYFFVYDIGYKILDGGYVLLVRKQVE